MNFPFTSWGMRMPHLTAVQSAALFPPAEVLFALFWYLLFILRIRVEILPYLPRGQLCHKASQSPGSRRKTGKLHVNSLHCHKKPGI